MLRKAQAKATKTKVCPKCTKRKNLAKGFGFRTQHDAAGVPVRTLPQSYCRECRRGTVH